MLSVYPHDVSHKAWEMNNKKSISNYALMFLSYVYMNSSLFLYALICNFIRWGLFGGIGNERLSGVMSHSKASFSSIES